MDHDQHVKDYFRLSGELYGNKRTECEVWSRVMGYYRPVQWYNVGKKQEFADRTYFIEP